MIDRLLPVWWLSDFLANLEPGSSGRWRNQRSHVLLKCTCSFWRFDLLASYMSQQNASTTLTS